MTERTRCPRCGSRLKYFGDYWICEFCGYDKKQYEKDLQRWFSD